MQLYTYNYYDKHYYVQKKQVDQYYYTVKDIALCNINKWRKRSSLQSKHREGGIQNISRIIHAITVETQIELFFY